MYIATALPSPHLHRVPPTTPVPARGRASHTPGTNQSLSLTLPSNPAAHYHRAAVQSNEVYPPP
jgi:hypothetical protein